MKRYLLLFILVLFKLTIQAQITPSAKILFHGKNKPVSKDTTIESDTTKENKEPQYFYASAITNVFVNTRGGVAKRFAPGIEFGRTYGIFDIGLSVGKFSLLSDTVQYIEFRPTINVFSKGRFAEALCLGGGYSFNAKQGLVTEICNSINFSINETMEVAVQQGFYYFDGTNSSRGTQYMGFTFTYNFLKPHSTNKRRKKAAIVNDN